MTKIAYIPQDAPFNEDQRAWISGFLAGLHSRLAMSVNAPPPAVADQVEPGPSLRILYGTQTGNAEGVANDAAAAAKSQGFDVTVSGLDEIELEEFAGLKYVLIVTSTYG
jgi:sulfite reductase (NADPH) flavoprotein alpha-component